MKPIKIALFFLLFLTLACSTFKLKPTDFAWPVESVLKINDDGKVVDDRYAIEFDTKDLFYLEFQDSSAYKNKELRLLRNVDGYYFITSEKFKNVYVFNADERALVLENKIFITDLGIENPALNQRKPFVEIIDGDKSLYLTKDGIDRIAK